jgi:hypothetical protein
LVVDHHDAVLADRETDVTPRAFEVVDAARDVVRRDLDVAEVASLGAAGRRGTERHERRDAWRERRKPASSHQIPPLDRVG